MNPTDSHARTAALDAHADLGRAYVRLAAAALDARDERPGADAALQHALRAVECTTVARRRATAIVHKLEAVTAALDARSAA